MTKLRLIEPDGLPATLPDVERQLHSAVLVLLRTVSRLQFDLSDSLCSGCTKSMMQELTISLEQAQKQARWVKTLLASEEAL